MDDPQRTPVAGVVITVLVLIVGAYLLAPDDDPSGAVDRTDTPERPDSTVYPGDPSLPDPAGGTAPAFPGGDEPFVVIEPDDDPN